MDYGILHLDAYTVHKTKAVKELARRKGFVLIAPHEGGITGVTQWNDLDCHNVVDARLIALEEDDFHQSLRLRPNRVPTRKRQTVLSDVAAIWTTFAHERMTTASAVRSGLGVVLPEQLPSDRVSLVGVRRSSRHAGSEGVLGCGGRASCKAVGAVEGVRRRGVWGAAFVGAGDRLFSVA